MGFLIFLLCIILLPIALIVVFTIFVAIFGTAAKVHEQLQTSSQAEEDFSLKKWIEDNTPKEN